MKNIQLVISSLLLAAAFPAPAFARPLAGAQVDESTTAQREELVPLADIRHIKVGMTADEVLASMRGKPDETMTPQVWIYWDFKGLKRPADMKQPATLIFFTNDRVSDIRYSETALVRKTLAELRAAATAPVVAVK
jgi:hypothetical protein